MANPDSFIAPETEQLNKSLPGFRVETLIASSETSAVYLATQTSLDRHVALRLYSPAASENPEFVQSVGNMAISMARLNHPNLISIFDSGCLDGMIYLVMEFVAGKSLARSLGGHAIDHAQARSITTAICEGIAHAHQYGVAHGKLTANDILLNPSTEPKIGNFGGGDFSSDSIQDIIQIGKLLFRMLTGSEYSAFSPPPSKLVGSPPDLDEFCDRCIERNRDDAFETMQELCDALAPPKPSLSPAQPSGKQPVAAQSARRPVAMAPASRHYKHAPPPLSRGPTRIQLDPGSQHHRHHHSPFRNQTGLGNYGSEKGRNPETSINCQRRGG